MNYLTYSPDAPRCLETHGLYGCLNYEVNEYPGSYSSRGDIRPDIPLRAQRSPKDDNPWYSDQRQARRIHALLEAGKERGHLTERAYREILRRLMTLHPLCLGGF